MSKLKKTVCLVLALLMVFSIGATNAFAADEYDLHNSVPVYANAYDAASKTNQIASYNAGKYYIFREFNNMLNISRDPSSAGGWINPNDNISIVKETRVVNISTLNVRSRATTSSSILGQVYKGNVLEGQKEGNWFKITFNGKTAYVSYQYTSPSTSIVTEKRYVTSRQIIVRSKPSSTASTYGFVYKGQEYIGEKIGAWFKINYNGKDAYIAYMFTGSSAPSSQEERQVSSSQLIVRSDKSSTSKILGIIKEGTKITGELEGAWFKFNYDNKTAYVAYKFTESVSSSTKPVEEKEPIVEEQLETRYPNRDSINVREQASTSSKLLGEYFLNDELKGVRIGDWLKTTFEGKVAYVWYAYTSPNKTVKEETPTEELSGQEVREVNINYLNVRSSASTNSRVLGVITKGTQITGIQQDAWFKTNLFGQVAYVAYKYTDGLEKTPEENVNPLPGGDTSNPDDFVLVLDPGHGAGIDYNRGGVLFNEGDQNYYFSLKLLEKAAKYKNVTIKTTRSNIYADPSLSERAAFGKDADLFLSLHTNAAPYYGPTEADKARTESIRGVEVFSSHYSTNTKMGAEISNMVSNLLPTPNRGLKFLQYSGEITSYAIPNAKDYWGVFRYENNAKTKYLIEFVFHTNETDSKLYLEKQDQLAEELMKIIAKNYGLVLK